MEECIRSLYPANSKKEAKAIASVLVKSTATVDRRILETYTEDISKQILRLRHRITSEQDPATVILEVNVFLYRRRTY